MIRIKMFKPNNIIKKNVFMAGLYGRLSDEDKNKVEEYMESESIKNQRDYLHYAVGELNKQENAIPIEIYKEYFDDDYTGITFNRPNFQAMMEDVREGRIDCIIVKDFSRFGRDYSRILKYLETDFRKKGHEVRFIAYSDNFDSLMDEPNIGNRFSIFLNEEYSRNQSHKVSTAIESKMRVGKYIGAFAPYGYKKDPNDKNHLIVDEEVREIVEDIFRMNLKEGLGVTEIAKRLNERNIDPPTIYKEKKKINFRAGNRLPTTNYWTPDTVNRMLKDEKYTGTMVQCKTKTMNLKEKTRKIVSKNEWIRVSNMHEAIISKEDFDAVQHLHTSVPKNRNKNSDKSIYAGMLKCGDCGRALIKGRDKYKDKRYYFHQCRTHKRDSSRCYTNRIYDNHLSEILLGDLNMVIGSIQDIKEVLLKCNTKCLNHNRKKAMQDCIAQKSERLREQEALMQGAEDKWLLGKIEDDKYNQMRDRFQKEIEKIKQEIKKMEHTYEDSKEVLSNKWVKSLLEMGYVGQLSREMVIEVVDSILIYHDDRLEINYKFSSELESIFKMEKAQPLTKKTGR